MFSVLLTQEPYISIIFGYLYERVDHEKMILYREYHGGSVFHTHEFKTLEARVYLFPSHYSRVCRKWKALCTRMNIARSNYKTHMDISTLMMENWLNSRLYHDYVDKLIQTSATRYLDHFFSIVNLYTLCDYRFYMIFNTIHRQLPTPQNAVRELLLKSLFTTKLSNLGSRMEGTAIGCLISMIFNPNTTKSEIDKILGWLEGLYNSSMICTAIFYYIKGRDEELFEILNTNRLQYESSYKSQIREMYTPYRKIKNPFALLKNKGCYSYLIQHMDHAFKSFPGKFSECISFIMENIDGFDSILREIGAETIYKLFVMNRYTYLHNLEVMERDCLYLIFRYHKQPIPEELIKYYFSKQAPRSTAFFFRSTSFFVRYCDSIPFTVRKGDFELLETIFTYVHDGTCVMLEYLVSTMQLELFLNCAFVHQSKMRLFIIGAIIFDLYCKSPILPRMEKDSRMHIYLFLFKHTEVFDIITEEIQDLISDTTSEEITPLFTNYENELYFTINQICYRLFKADC